MDHIYFYIYIYYVDGSYRFLSISRSDAFRACSVGVPQCVSRNGHSPSDCGNKMVSIIFYYSFFILVFLILQNFFIAVVLDTYVSTSALLSESESLTKVGFNMNDLEAFRSVWSIFDNQALGYMSKKKLLRFLKKLEMPLGLRTRTVSRSWAKEGKLTLDDLRLSKDVSKVRPISFISRPVAETMPRHDRHHLHQPPQSPVRVPLRFKTTWSKYRRHLPDNSNTVSDEGHHGLEHRLATKEEFHTFVEIMARLDELTYRRQLRRGQRCALCTCKRHTVHRYESI
jgi:hypothetical protein